MELSVRERQKALMVTLAMLCIACVCLFYLGYRLCMYYQQSKKKVRLDDSGRTFLAIKADELFAFFLKLVDSKCHGTYFGIERISFN